MKVNKKVSVINAVKFEYTYESQQEITNLLSNTEILFDKARHPSAIGRISILYFNEFSNIRKRMDGVEGDWVVRNNDCHFEIINDKEFQKDYEIVI